jgi:small subunit ribosomal protein S3
MGQKVNPISFRLGYIRSWDSLWFAKKKGFADNLLEDIKIRKHIKDNFKQCAISSVVIERASEKIRVNIHTARPGVIIGRKGADIDRLRDDLQKLIGKDVQINIREVKNPALDAQLVAENVALQLEKRISFRRAMKKAIQQTLDAGAKGIKVRTKGRLGGAEIARSEWYRVGSVPLQTIRADIDYGFAEAVMTYGKIGVKVWIYKGEIMDRPDLFDVQARAEKIPEKRAPAAGGKPEGGAAPLKITTGPAETAEANPAEIFREALGDTEEAAPESPEGEGEGGHATPA